LARFPPGPMNLFHQKLPIAAVLPQVMATLRQGHAILSAPTGSGKTTLVPLVLSAEDWLLGRKIIMLEPRRIAARAAAARMSELAGTPVGETVGYRIRFDSRVSPRTRIEVVTEGILTRMLQSDSGLDDAGLIIFDEFHERSLHADLGLALCLDLCQLRPDLRLLVMSATLDTAPLSELMGGAPVLTAKGRSYPVEVRYLPPGSDSSIPANVARGIEHAWRTLQGDILAFLPGAGEIRAVGDLLAGRLTGAEILPLYGDLPFAEQNKALTPGQHCARRIILATPIAETSITIEGISCVVDSGLARRPRFDPATGLDRLETVRISRASAEQRRGRAGRLGPGHCFRLWNGETDLGLLPFTPPEIVTGDLTPLVLELALWGVSDPAQLKWLDPPRAGAWACARDLLQSLGALDHRGHITVMGRKAARLPAHPRLAAMLLAAGDLHLTATACMIASLLSERDILRGPERSCDLRDRLQAMSGSGRNTSLAGRRRIRQQIEQWRKLLPKSAEPIRNTRCGLLLSFSYPDRIAVLRKGSRDAYQLTTGKRAVLPAGDLLAGSPFLVVAQLDAGQQEVRIYLAAPVEEDDLRAHHPGLFSDGERIWWDAALGRVQTAAESRLGSIVLESRPLPGPDQEKVLACFLAGVREIGAGCLPWTDAARQIQARIGSLRLWQEGDWPDLSDSALSADLGWLAPFCSGMTSLSQLKRLDMTAILLSQLPWDRQSLLNRLAPTHITVPSGSRIRLQYEPGRPPLLAVRIQEMFGQAATPAVCDNQVKVTVSLLSPSRRPIQITADLESFWCTTYAAVKKELAGRYPKHYWPDDPCRAAATSRTKKAMQQAAVSLPSASRRKKT
jgi:ATP-dependent helicase HrpB